MIGVDRQEGNESTREDDGIKPSLDLSPQRNLSDDDDDERETNTQRKGTNTMSYYMSGDEKTLGRVQALGVKFGYNQCQLEDDEGVVAFRREADDEDGHELVRVWWRTGTVGTYLKLRARPSCSAAMSTTSR